MKYNEDHMIDMRRFCKCEEAGHFSPYRGGGETLSMGDNASLARACIERLADLTLAWSSIDERVLTEFSDWPISRQNDLFLDLRKVMWPNYLVCQLHVMLHQLGDYITARGTDPFLLHHPWHEFGAEPFRSWIVDNMQFHTDYDVDKYDTHEATSWGMAQAAYLTYTARGGAELVRCIHNWREQLRLMHGLLPSQAVVVAAAIAYLNIINTAIKRTRNTTEDFPLPCRDMLPESLKQEIQERRKDDSRFSRQCM